MIIVDLIILALVIAGIADVYERVARAIKAHRQLKDSSSSSVELDELKERIQILEEKLNAHKHAPRRRSVGE